MVYITDTILRDAHQSLLATRMRTEDMLPAVAELDRLGYWSLEVWGGATFDTAYRFLREDPWERLREIKKRAPNTRLQMLLRGQNLVGYRHYADDTVELFCERAAANGVDVFRIFDALNDLRNLETAFRATKRAGGWVEGTICYTTSPAHTVAGFVEMGQHLEQMGADSICIKDMAGLLTPYIADQLVRGLKNAVRAPIHMHCHATSGLAEMTYVKGVEAGADIIDTAISAIAGGTSQPPTESLVATFQGTPHDTGLDLSRLAKLAEYFAEVRTHYHAFEANLVGVDVGVLEHQIPGGMISNLISQLRELGALDKLPQVLEETARVRAELGYPPLVTPSSQIVGVQAVMNALSPTRYARVTSETRNLVLGRYGATPVPIDPALQHSLSGGEPPIHHRPADDVAPELETARREIGALARTDEDLLAFVMFPDVAREFLQWREAGSPPDRQTVAAIVAALAPPPAAAADTPANGAAETSPWRLAGRRRLQGTRA